jgi:diguanylate cyclase (GGDEF)-like protein
MNAQSKPAILVVDDTPANLVAMRKLLKGADAHIVEAASGNAALAACLDHEFALILLDVNMPDMDGFEVAQYLGGEERTRDIPIIFVTAAYADDMNRLKGYANGAVDYIAKPINDIILQSKVRVFLDLHRSKQALRDNVRQLSQLNEQLNQEMEERVRAEERARHQATHDPLTGVPNRALFMDRLQLALDRGRRASRPFALLYIDIDGFKPVNDRHGHHAGDLLLKAITQRLGERLRKSDTLARLGGDEFAVILEEQVDVPDDAVHAAENLCGLLQQPFPLEGDLVVQVGASIGVALFPQSAGGAAGDARETLIRAADQAMYRAKKGGKNRVELAGS